MPQSVPYLPLIILADDDVDDILLFEEALMELGEKTQLSVASDGEELMEMLGSNIDREKKIVIFLDMNMPKKNGFQCLKEIRKKANFDGIPVIIFSTSCQSAAIDSMYENGASFYVCKPDNFNKLKTSIQLILNIAAGNNFSRPSKANFLIAF